MRRECQLRGRSKEAQSACQEEQFVTRMALGYGEDTVQEVGQHAQVSFIFEIEIIKQVSNLSKA